MSSRLRLFAGMLSLIAATCLRAQTTLSGEEILRKVSENYRAPQRFLISATLLDWYSGSEVSTTAIFAAELPDKLRLEGNGSAFGVPSLGTGSVSIVLDGNVTWLYDSDSRLYFKIPRASPPGGKTGLDGGTEPSLDQPEQLVAYFSGALFLRYVDYFATGKVGATEKIPVHGKDVECYVVELQSRPGAPTYTWWVDKQNFIIWREDLSKQVSGIQQRLSSSKFENVVLNSPLPKDTFVFVPPIGSKLGELPAP